MKRVAAIALVSAGCFLLFMRLPLSADYQHYMAATRALLDGSSQLYDAGAHEFYYLPWSMILTVPLQWLPVTAGRALLGLLSVLGVVLSVRLLAGPGVSWLTWGAIMVNLYTVNMVFSGQWDGIVAGAVGIAWWGAEKRNPLLLGAGLLLASTKPTHALIVCAVICWQVLMSWNWREIGSAAVLPAIVFVLSLAVCGLDWPLRYVEFLQTNPPPEIYNLAMYSGYFWQALALALVAIGWLGVVIWRRGVDRLAIALAMAVSLVSMPYLLSYHMTMASPLLARLGMRNAWLAVLPWGIMAVQTALLGSEAKLHYFVYPLAITIMGVLFTGLYKQGLEHRREIKEFALG